MQKKENDFGEKSPHVFRADAFMTHESWTIWNMISSQRYLLTSTQPTKWILSALCEPRYILPSPPSSRQQPLLSELDEHAVDFVSDRAFQSSLAKCSFPKISAKRITVKLLRLCSIVPLYSSTLSNISLSPCEVACLRLGLPAVVL